MTFDSCISLSGFLIISRVQAAATDWLTWVQPAALGSRYWTHFTYNLQQQVVFWPFVWGQGLLVFTFVSLWEGGEELSSKGMGPVVIPCKPGVPNYGQVCQEMFGAFWGHFVGERQGWHCRLLDGDQGCGWTSPHNRDPSSPNRQQCWGWEAGLGWWTVMWFFLPLMTQVSVILLSNWCLLIYPWCSYKTSIAQKTTSIFLVYFFHKCSKYM